jgi:hypothetical protein
MNIEEVFRPEKQEILQDERHHILECDSNCSHRRERF